MWHCTHRVLVDVALVAVGRLEVEALAPVVLGGRNRVKKKEKNEESAELEAAERKREVSPWACPWD